MENEKKQGLKPWAANLIVFALELLTMVIYLKIGGRAIRKVLEGDIGGAFDNVVAGIWFINIAALILAILILVIKPLRTKTNKAIAIWNLIWVALNIYCIYG